MKAKRIAEIAHKMSQLNKEMDALSAALNDEHGPAFAAQLIAKAIIENTLKAKRIAELKNAMVIARMNHDWLTASLICAELSAVIATASKPCSNQLRAELTANNIEMNRLTERNDAILSTLRGRGLEPVRMRDDVKCKVRFVVDKPLTNEQLRAGDWFCREVSAGVTQLLIDKDISYCIKSNYHGIHVKYATPLNSKPTKEIIRKGNEFYYA